MNPAPPVMHTRFPVMGMNRDPYPL
jgi:hypothetical protein